MWAKAKAESPELSEHLKVHKPYIDAVTFQSPKDPEGRMRRVTEVIDVWFDAGSMPFAQWGYPHLEGSEERFNNSFPADFISEAIDQTRGWFYALLAISTVVHEDKKGAWPHPFKNCICLGHILGEDGRKLSKRLKNYSEPGLLFEKFSADALRWSFVAKNPPTNSSRLSERIVEESQRELLMRWYNVYSFFVIYANLDGFDPSQAPQAVLQELFADPTTAPVGGTGGDAVYRPAAERAELDRWILSELDRVVVDVRKAMDNYETCPAAREISGFVDGLSNWYVRRSRARFWASGWSEDKADAYWTLYECLIKLARLAAPFTPFFAEVTWRNLAKPVPGAAESVHLTTYPEADASAIDHGLLEQMELTREAVTLGLSARRVENIKVRQPLGLCELVVANPEHRVALENHLDLIKEELNIKEVAFTDSPEEYVSYDVRPNFKVLGPRFGKNVQQVRKALASADGAALLAQLQDGGIKVEIDGKEECLCAEEVDVRLTPKEGFAAAQGKQMVVVIATEITAELRKEGLVREVIRALQDIRKEQGLAYDARINVTYATDDAALNEAIADFRDYIAQEVLASALESGDMDGDAKVVTIDGNELGLLVTTA
ncbi:MAG: DUF5915 domain-containing protein [Candidatus Hydrogenedentes bacterium]|nr:DUF5915 domain-containing protein [Candidatus Hydrogenedentota bacterium]